MSNQELPIFDSSILTVSPHGQTGIEVVRYKWQFQLLDRKKLPRRLLDFRFCNYFNFSQQIDTYDKINHKGLNSGEIHEY